MAGPLSRPLFARQLTEGLNTVFGLEYKQHPQQWKEIYDVETSAKAAEEDLATSGFGGAQIKGEGAGVAYDTAQELWTARYLHKTVALAFAITEEAVEDGLYGDLGAKYSKALARSMVHTKELIAADVLNNGYSSSYPGGDGVALFSTAHPMLEGTYANTLSTQADMSETSIEEMSILIDSFVDDRGIPIVAMAKKLIVPKELRFTAIRLLESEKRPGTADNDVNALRRNGTIPDWCVNHRLSDPDQWTIKTDVPDGLKMFQRVKLQRGTQGDFETGNMKYKTRERYSFGWTDPRGAVGSSGAAG